MFAHVACRLHSILRRHTKKIEDGVRVPGRPKTKLFCDCSRCYLNRKGNKEKQNVTK